MGGISTMNEIYVGKTLDGFPLVLPNDNRTEHVQIIASTGRGKTWGVVAPWSIQDFVSGKDVILIDGKGDQKLPDQIRRFARNPNDVIVFDLGDLDGSATTNPIQFGTPQQIADRIFATFEFENHYYETVSYEALLLVLELFRARGKVATFREIYRRLTDDAKLTVSR
jgi:type IV secretory pathway TraG/TraD family ATPase VirD4